MPDVVLVLKLLCLLVVANGIPVLAKKVFGSRGALPLDGNRQFADGRPLLGPSKTVRGLVLSVLFSGLAAPLLGWTFTTGALFGALAMAGDLLSSFIKRRLGMASSSMALGLDQVPESLLPLLGLSAALGIGAFDMAAVVALFFVGELVLSRLLYHLNVRDRPW